MSINSFVWDFAILAFLSSACTHMFSLNIKTIYLNEKEKAKWMGERIKREKKKFWIKCTDMKLLLKAKPWLTRDFPELCVDSFFLLSFFVIPLHSAFWLNLTCCVLWIGGKAKRMWKRRRKQSVNESQKINGKYKSPIENARWMGQKEARRRKRHANSKRTDKATHWKSANTTTITTNRKKTNAKQKNANYMFHSEHWTILISEHVVCL